MNTQDPKTKFTSEDKLQYEVEKLREEIRNFKKPYFTTPTFWFAFVTVIISIGSFVFQSKISELKNLELEQKNKILRDESEKLFAKNTLLKNENNSLEKQNKNQGKIIIKTDRDLEKIAEHSEISQKTEINAVRKQIKDARLNFTKTLSADIGTAKKKEREGFQFLAEGKLDKASVSFTESENAKNGYNASYDIAKFLINRKKEIENSENAKKEALKQILQEFSGYIPNDLKREIEYQTK